MRIVHVIGTLNPAWGGPVEGVRNITAQAIYRGHDVHIVTLDHPDSPWLASWLPQVHAVGSSRSTRDKYRFTPRLDRWLAEHLRTFDRLVIHSIWMYFSYAAWKAARKTKTPYYLFLHGALDPWFKKKYPLKDLKKKLYWALIEHRVLRDAQAVLFTTREEMLLANDSYVPYQCKPAVIGYGIAPPPTDHSFSKDTFLRELTATFPALQARNFILFLSRIHEKKGLDLLLAAFAKLRFQLPNLALLIAGPGDAKYITSLKNSARNYGIEKDVIWTGPLYGEAKFRALRAAEVYILPSHQENFGIGIVEALACGTPVLISDKVNIWREVEAEGAGLVAADTEKGTVSLLQQWSAFPATSRLEMREQAKMCFERHFDMRVACERLFEVVLADLPSSHQVTPALQLPLSSN